MTLRAYLLAALLAVFSPLVNAQELFLGAADSFAVLGGSAVTNTGATIVNGNLGVSPGSAVTGFPPGVVVNGTIFSGAGSLAGQAHLDTIVAFNVLKNESGGTNLTGVNLGGLTLSPGIYHFDTSAQVTGILRLNTGGDPNATFHFQIGSTLTLASGASVITLGLNGDPGRNIFWQVGSSATLGTGSSLDGNILAQASITLNTGARLRGRALAIDGAVNLAGNSVSNATLLNFVLVPGPGNTVILLLLQGSFGDLLCLTPNEVSVASALDKLARAKPLSKTIMALNTVTIPFLPDALDLLAPVGYAPIFDAGFALAELQSGNIERRLGELRDGATEFNEAGLSGADSHGTVSATRVSDGKRMIDDKGKMVAEMPYDRRWGFFITGTGQWVDIEGGSNPGCGGHGGTVGSDFVTGGVTVGADYRLTETVAFGLSAGYANTSVDGAGDGKISINHANTNAYVTWFDRGFYVNGIIGAGYSYYVGSSRVDLQACKLEYSIVSPK